MAPVFYQLQLETLFFGKPLLILFGVMAFSLARDGQISMTFAGAHVWSLEDELHWFIGDPIMAFPLAPPLGQKHFQYTIQYRNNLLGTKPAEHISLKD